MGIDLFGILVGVVVGEGEVGLLVLGVLVGKMLGSPEDGDILGSLVGSNDGFGEGL